jgi:hypothetical protein
MIIARAERQRYRRHPFLLTPLRQFRTRALTRSSARASDVCKVVNQV